MICDWRSGLSVALFIMFLLSVWAFFMIVCCNIGILLGQPEAGAFAGFAVTIYAIIGGKK